MSSIQVEQVPNEKLVKISFLIFSISLVSSFLLLCFADIIGLSGKEMIMISVLPLFMGSIFLSVGLIQLSVIEKYRTLFSWVARICMSITIVIILVLFMSFFLNFWNLTEEEYYTHPLTIIVLYMGILILPFYVGSLKRNNEKS